MTTDPNTPELDDTRRAELLADRCATMALWFLLDGLEPGFAAAVDAASTPCGCCPDDVGLAMLPAAIFRAVSLRLHGPARRVLEDPRVLADAAPIAVCCATDRAVVEVQVSRLITRLAALLTDAERGDLRLRCVDGDRDFELRCLRSGLMRNLGALRGDDAMLTEAATAALRECYERRAGLTIAAVWSVASPFVYRHRRLDAAGLDDALAAELRRLSGLMLDPDAVVGGTS